VTHHVISLPPALSAKRSKIFCIRLTVQERQQIEQLAKHLNLPDSTMARHFVMEAVAFHSQQVEEGAFDRERS